MLVFTQFREATQPIAAFLGHVFGREGLILHGGTPVSEAQGAGSALPGRRAHSILRSYLKAAAAGLNLTAASHVVHFDRWWNPAVENQATDRAFRIGSPAMFSCISSSVAALSRIKIDQLIESKQTLVKDVLSKAVRSLQLTELSDKELMNLVALDIHSAQANV